jgi:AbrB family transcriptional regulator (stage V sporulation protein T)
MKSTGIVRRIDDLGRIIIPKEIRRTIRVREGDPMEIFIDEKGEVILKKYSPIGQLGDFAQEYCDSLYESTGHIALIGDRDTIISVSGGSKKIYFGKITEDYGDIDDRKVILEDIKVFVPIIAEGDIVGAIILLAQEDYEGKFSNFEVKIAETAASFLAKQVGD